MTITASIVCEREFDHITPLLPGASSAARLTSQLLFVLLTASPSWSGVGLSVQFLAFLLLLYMGLRQAAKSCAQS